MSFTPIKRLCYLLWFDVYNPQQGKWAGPHECALYLKETIRNWKKNLSRAWNFILVCVTRTNKIYQGQKENTETAENQFCRLFIFDSLVSILAKRGSDNDPNRDRIHSPAWEERCYKILFDTIVCLAGPGISSFLKHDVPYLERGIDYD